MDSVLQFLLTAGIISVLITQVATSLRGASARYRERIALMSLVHLEIMQNQRIIERLSNSNTPTPFDTGEIAALHDDTWSENRSRIAQLEGERAVEYLGMYYTGLRAIISADRLDYEGIESLSRDELYEMFNALHENLGPLARYVCERQTKFVRGWSNGMLVVVGKWEPVKEVEDNWRRRQLGQSDDEDQD